MPLPAIGPFSAPLAKSEKSAPQLRAYLPLQAPRW